MRLLGTLLAFLSTKRVYWNNFNGTVYYSCLKYCLLCKPPHYITTIHYKIKLTMVHRIPQTKVHYCQQQACGSWKVSAQQHHPQPRTDHGH